MEKVIDFSKTVFEICKENPEVIEIMKELGFSDITNPGLLNTAGRFMTIPKGAAMKGIGLDKIKEAFSIKGFQIKEEGYRKWTNTLSRTLILKRRYHWKHWWNIKPGKLSAGLWRRESH